MSVIEDLEKIQKLKEQGILSDEEFEKEKQKILGKDVKKEQITNNAKQHINKATKNINQKIKKCKTIFINKTNRQHKKKFCSNCGNEILEEEKFCGKCGNKINNKKSFKLYIFIALIIVAIIIGVIIYNNNESKTTKQSQTNTNYENTTNSISSNSTNSTNTSSKLSLDDIEIGTWYKATDNNVDGATLLLINVSWNGIIKESYPNATLIKYTIYDQDGYGRYIVGVAFTKSSTSESLTYNWCCIGVEDINDSSKIYYCKLHPTGVSEIYNNSIYGWGTPLSNSKYYLED